MRQPATETRNDRGQEAVPQPVESPDGTTDSRAPATDVEDGSRSLAARLRTSDATAIAASVGLAVVGIAVWQVAVDQGLIREFLASSPQAVGGYLADALPDPFLWDQVRITMSEVALGFGIGASAGILAGLVLARVEFLRKVLNPYLSLLNALPRIALAPLFILWFGIGQASKVALVVSIVFFVLESNTRAAVRMVDPDLITMSRLMGASERQVFASVILPAIVPAVFGGLRLGVIYAFLMAVAGEMIAARGGIGAQLALSAGQFRTEAVMGLLLVVAVLALIINSIMTLFESRLLRWQSAGDAVNRIGA